MFCSAKRLKKQRKRETTDLLLCCQICKLFFPCKRFLWFLLCLTNTLWSSLWLSMCTVLHFLSLSLSISSLRVKQSFKGYSPLLFSPLLFFSCLSLLGVFIYPSCAVRRKLERIRAVGLPCEGFGDWSELLGSRIGHIFFFSLSPPFFHTLFPIIHKTKQICIVILYRFVESGCGIGIAWQMGLLSGLTCSNQMGLGFLQGPS